jgi:PAS domain S-box-containing protein
MAVLIATIIFETAIINTRGGTGFIVSIPAVIIIVYLEGRGAAIAAAVATTVVGLWAEKTLHGRITTDDWLEAIFLLVSGCAIAFIFHRLRRDLRKALEVAESRLAAVAETESRFRLVFERAAIGFANTNEKGELLQSNRHLCELTGYGGEELAQLSLVSLVHPDDRDAVLKSLAGQGDSTTPFGLEVRLSRKDGSTFWSRLILSPSHAGGLLSESAIVVVDDVSDRRTAREAIRIQKERLDLALSAGRLGTWQIDYKDGTVAGSSKFWDILGLPHANSLPLKELAAVVHPADWPRLATPKEPASSGDYDIEVRVRRIDGSIRWIALRGREERHDGQLLLIGVAADLTERRQTTLLRAAARKRERVLLEQRHRFSNLFSVITALVKMINVPENNVAKYKADLIDRIRALELTHTLLSRRSDGSVELQDLVAQELRLYLETRRITIEGPDVTMTSGAAETFAMVIHELTTNSVKHGALGDPGGLLDVSWGAASESAGSDIVFHWIETGRRKKDKVIGHGFGSMILGVDGQPLIGHSSKLEMADRGLRYSLRLSRREVEP